MRNLGFLVLGVMASAVVACAAGSSAGTSASDLTEGDASVVVDGGASDAAVVTDAAPASDAAVVTDAAVTDAGPAMPTYADVAPIIEASCASCHDAQFGTLDAVKENRAMMLNLVKRGRMPRGNPGFKDTADGQALILFLTASPELE